MKKHAFSSTRAAYDACQTDARIKDGDVLHIPDEEVVGLADAWPLAVTVEHGDLHKTAKGRVAQALTFAGISVEQAVTAVTFAQGKGYPVDPEFAALVTSEHLR